MTPREKRKKYLAKLKDDLDAIEDRIEQEEEVHPAVLSLVKEDVHELLGEARMSLILRRQNDELQRVNNEELMRRRVLEDDLMKLRIEKRGLHDFYEKAVRDLKDYHQALIKSKEDDSGKAKNEEAHE